MAYIVYDYRQSLNEALIAAMLQLQVLVFFGTSANKPISMLEHTEYSALNWLPTSYNFPLYIAMSISYTTIYRTFPIYMSVHDLQISLHKMSPHPPLSYLPSRVSELHPLPSSHMLPSQSGLRLSVATASVRGDQGAAVLVLIV